MMPSSGAYALFAVAIVGGAVLGVRFAQPTAASRVAGGLLGGGAAVGLVVGVAVIANGGWR